jgi:hypothetical protein
MRGGGEKKDLFRMAAGVYISKRMKEKKVTE